MSISTRRGDAGETDLLFGQRVRKDHPRVRALGDVDELNAALGLVRVHARCQETLEVARETQVLLIGLMGELATPCGQESRYEATHQQAILDQQVDWLDAWVARIEGEGAFAFKGWVLPGGAGVAAGAQADFARTIARRAERSIVEMQGTPEALPNANVVRFLNRLSDLLWLLARWEEKAAAES